jgi:hypothetical protein
MKPVRMTTNHTHSHIPAHTQTHAYPCTQRRCHRPANTYSHALCAHPYIYTHIHTNTHTRILMNMHIHIRAACHPHTHTHTHTVQKPVCQKPVCQMPLCQMPLCQMPLCQMPVCQMPVCQMPVCQMHMCQMPVWQMPLCVRCPYVSDASGCPMHTHTCLLNGETSAPKFFIFLLHTMPVRTSVPATPHLSPRDSSVPAGGGTLPRIRRCQGQQGIQFTTFLLRHDILHTQCAETTVAHWEMTVRVLDDVIGTLGYVTCVLFLRNQFCSRRGVVLTCLLSHVIDSQ